MAEVRVQEEGAPVTLCRLSLPPSSPAPPKLLGWATERSTPIIVRAVKRHFRADLSIQPPGDPRINLSLSYIELREAPGAIRASYLGPCVIPQGEDKDCPTGLAPRDLFGGRGESSLLVKLLVPEHEGATSWRVGEYMFTRVAEWGQRPSERPEQSGTQLLRSLSLEPNDLPPIGCRIQQLPAGSIILSASREGARIVLHIQRENPEVIRDMARAGWELRGVQVLDVPIKVAAYRKPPAIDGLPRDIRLLYAPDHTG